MADPDIVAQEGRSYGFRDGRGQDWTESWHPPELPAPDGRRHGSGGICFTPEGAIVLVTQDGASWEFPAGRPEGDEDWRETLDREMLEEACAVVEDATLLGYARGTCLAGFEAGLVLVRSLWVAEVTLQPWRPQHETTGRSAGASRDGAGHGAAWERAHRPQVASRGPGHAGNGVSGAGSGKVPARERREGPRIPARGRTPKGAGCGT